MCELYTDTTTTDWLQSQVTVLDCWIEDIATNPDCDQNLLGCLSTHRSWLKKELKILSNNSKPRKLANMRASSGFVKRMRRLS